MQFARSDKPATAKESNVAVISVNSLVYTGQISILRESTTGATPLEAEFQAISFKSSSYIIFILDNHSHHTTNGKYYPPRLINNDHPDDDECTFVIMSTKLLPPYPHPQVSRRGVVIDCQ